MAILVFGIVLVGSFFFEASIAYIFIKINLKFNSAFSLIGAALAVFSLLLFMPRLTSLVLWYLAKYFQSIGVALDFGHAGEAFWLIEEIGYLEALLVFIVFLYFLTKLENK
jgi:hypothetical protein